ncbi:MAG: PaaI family thioesterase [Pseudomonadales bacterium]|nr:PaaI family thioesterase [Pseudomonadales bacterium]
MTRIKPEFEFNEKIAESFMRPKASLGGLHEYLGIKIVEVGPGTMHGQLEVRDELLTYIGNMHGGVLSAFSDHMLGSVCYPVMKKGQWAATTEFKINLTAPVSKGVVDAYAEIINLSRTMAVVQIELVNEGRLAAIAQGTVTIRDPR